MTRLADVSDALRTHYRAMARDDGGDLSALQARAAGARPVRSLGEVMSSDALALIVEPKRSSQTRGMIHPDLDLAAVARECEAAGASAISINTDPQLALGSRDDLVAARGACELPLLARDVIVDVRQVLELRGDGADALLIPVACHLAPQDDFETGSLSAIITAAHRTGMEVVLSVTSDDELEIALDSDADALNIDNRDAAGMVDVERTFELLSDVPVGWPVISESIAAPGEVAKLQRAGVDALLLDEGHLDIGLTAAVEVFSDLSLDA